MKTILFLLLPILCFSQDTPVGMHREYGSGRIIWKGQGAKNYVPPGKRRDTLILREEVRGYGLVIIKGRPQPFVKRLIKHNYQKGSYIEYDADTSGYELSRWGYKPTGTTTFYDYLIPYDKYSLPYGKWLSEDYLVIHFKPDQWEFTDKDRRQSKKYFKGVVRKLRRK